MGYFLRQSPEIISRLATLASLLYQEAHEDTPKEALVDESEMTVIVNGEFTECYTFDQLFNGG